MENVDIAHILEQVGDLLEIQGANPFRVRAYRNAQRTVESHPAPLRKLVEEGANLSQLPAIGKEMASHITELVTTGRLTILDELASEVPKSLIELMRLPGVGPKKASKLWQELGIETVDALEQAAQAGQVAELAGFGEKSQEKILAGIVEYHQHRTRFRLADADRFVEPLVEHLCASRDVERLEVAGSYRRRRETVGDIDLLAISKTPARVMRRFTSYTGIETVEMAGDTRATVVLQSGLQVDLRALPRKSYGAALVYFTGSKEHNIKLRQRALDRGLRVSEYGVFRAETTSSKDAADSGQRDPWVGEQVAGHTEHDVYAAVDLPWIPPELREDRGEIEAAAKDELPRLVEVRDIRGDLQMHSTWSDGKNTIEEMLVACAERGYEYMALTDHSKALAMVGGLDAKRLRQQWREIQQVTERHPEIRLLRSMEVDILGDGSLDLDDESLGELDLVVISVHSKLDLPASQQTKRILRAIQHPAVHILAHPTGRLINRRSPMELDLDEILHCAAERGVAVELNAHPERLDLKDTHLMRARELGVKVVISTDAHRTDQLDLMRYGIEQARRGWLTKSDVLNTLPLKKFLKAIETAS